jgi:BirA family biotin operon repressor/biotin-[acetyl-CoA-carboxylase] ligase
VKFLQAEWADQLPSTNAAVLDQLGRGAVKDGYVLAVHEQTAGRGRFDRQWITQAGRDLTFSCVVPCGERAHLTSLPMAAALAVVDLLEQFGLEGHTKWPNDVMVGGRKICGMLAELPPEGGGRENPDTSAHQGDMDPAELSAVLGIGLNVNMDGQLAATIDRPVTSILLETGQERPVAAVLGSLLRKLEYWLSQWSQGGFGPLKTTWYERCAHLGAEVQLRDGESTLRGVAEGFGDRGQLCLRLSDGTLSEIWSGDLDSG